MRKVYLSILFLHFSLSVQLNRSWGYYLRVIHFSITQWRTEIRIFHTRFSRVSKLRSELLLCNYCTIACYFICCMALTLFIWGVVELNPGPKNTKSYHFSLLSLEFQQSFCSWLCLTIINWSIQYTAQFWYDMSLSETYLDSSYTDDDTRLNLN